MIALLERRWVRYPLFLFIGVVTFFVALVFAFPGNEIKDIIEVQAEKALKHKYDVEIGDVDLYWLTGLELKDVKLAKVDENKLLEKSNLKAAGEPETAPKEFKFPAVAARLAIFRSLINLAPAVQFKLDVGGGDISGTTVIKKQNVIVDASIGPIDLLKTGAIKAFLGVPFFGELEGDVDMTFDQYLRAPIKGHATLKGDKITFGPGIVKMDKLPSMAFIEVPQTNLGNLDLEVVVDPAKPGEMPNTVIKKCNFAGRDMRGDIWGRIMPERGQQPELAMEMRVQFDTQFVTKNSLGPLFTISKVRAGKNKDWYGFKLSGVLPKVKFMGAPEVADGPNRAALKPGNAPDGDANNADNGAGSKDGAGGANPSLPDVK